MISTDRLRQEAALRYKVLREPRECSDGNWATTDIFSAAFLAAKGNRCVGISATADKDRLAFLIEPQGNFSKDLADLNSNGLVRIRDFKDSFYFLKAQLRNFSRPDSTDY